MCSSAYSDRASERAHRKMKRSLELFFLDGCGILILICLFVLIAISSACHYESEDDQRENKGEEMLNWFSHEREEGVGALGWMLSWLSWAG